jgi:beta-galactosidase
LNAVIDVRGWNYHVGPDMDEYHAAHPQQPNIGTETSSILTTRGIYAIDQARGYQSAYDDRSNVPRDDASTAEFWWTYYRARPWLSGGFAWTGFDYRGENGWPDVVSNYGIMDLAGFPKDNYYYYQSWWTTKNVLHLLPHWNWPGKEGQNIDVRSFSNLDEVELFLNGKSLGRKTMPRNSHLQWTVPYEPGTLMARGFKDGNLAAEQKVETTGPPAAIQLTPDRATINPDGEDVSVITVAVTDAQGRVVPVANNLVDFEISGPGKIIGVGNGDPSSHDPEAYVSYSPDTYIPLSEWRWKLVPDTSNRAETAAEVQDSDWNRVDINAASDQLSENSSAVYRAHVNLNAEDLSAGDLVLRFGSIDDEGSVYINGQPVGESHDWRSSPAFNIRKLVHEGDNSIAVVVHNKDGDGGIRGGATLTVPSRAITPQWRRSAFNGLAQVIVQSGTTPGTIHLTARANGLASNAIVIGTEGHSPRPQAAR